jgi:SAM-dependent methyltransferase
MVVVSDRIPQGDIDPAAWSDHAATYDHVASLYAEKFVHELAHKPFDRDLLDRFAAALASRATAAAPVCDVGCGPGHIGAYLADRDVAVVGIDLSSGMVAQARQCFGSLTFSVGDMTALTLADQSLTGIACFYALIHLPRSAVPVALAEMHRVLAGNGELLLAVHGGQGTLFADTMLGQPVRLNATLFTLTELSGLVESAGFSIVEAHERAPYAEESATQRLYLWARRGD